MLCSVFAVFENLTLLKLFRKRQSITPSVNRPGCDVIVVLLSFIPIVYDFKKIGRLFRSWIRLYIRDLLRGYPSLDPRLPDIIGDLSSSRRSAFYFPTARKEEK